jgi:hypothetical protein
MRISRIYLASSLLLVLSLTMTAPNVFSPKKETNVATITFEGHHSEYASITLAPSQSFTWTAPPPPAGWVLNYFESDWDTITGITQTELLTGSTLKVTNAHVYSFKFDPNFNYVYYYSDPNSNSITIENHSTTSTITFNANFIAVYLDVQDTYTVQVDDSHSPMRKVFIAVPIGFVNQYDPPNGIFNMRIGFRVTWEGKAVPQRLINPGPAGADLLPYRTAGNAYGRFMRIGATTARIYISRFAANNGFYELGKPVEGCCWELDLKVIDPEQPAWFSQSLFAQVENQMDLRQTVTLNQGQSLTLTPPSVRDWNRDYTDFLAIESETSGVDATTLSPSTGVSVGCYSSGPYGSRSCWVMYGDTVTLTNTGTTAAQFSIDYQVLYSSSLDFKDKTRHQGTFVRHDLTFKLPAQKKYLGLGFDGPAAYSSVRINIPLTNPAWQMTSFITPAGANANDQSLNNPAMDLELGYLEGETLWANYAVRGPSIGFMYQVLGDGAKGDWTITLYEPT